MREPRGAGHLQRFRLRTSQPQHAPSHITHVALAWDWLAVHPKPPSVDALAGKAT